MTPFNASHMISKPGWRAASRAVGVPELGARRASAPFTSLRHGRVPDGVVGAADEGFGGSGGEIDDRRITHTSTPQAGPWAPPARPVHVVRRSASHQGHEVDSIVAPRGGRRSGCQGAAEALPA